MNMRGVRTSERVRNEEGRRVFKLLVGCVGSLDQIGKQIKMADNLKTDINGRFFPRYDTTGGGLFPYQTRR
jgi:hypothetical protein